MSTILAWHSTNWIVQDALHGLAGLLTSPLAAGVAALSAAFIAAKQVHLTRAADQASREADRKAESDAKKLDNLWERFEWIVDRSTSTNKAEKPVITATRAVAMLQALRDAAKPLGDEHLVSIVQSVLDHVVVSTSDSIR